MPACRRVESRDRRTPQRRQEPALQCAFGFARTIVDPTPGTTRDVVSFLASFGGWPVELAGRSLHAGRVSASSTGQPPNDAKNDTTSRVVPGVGSTIVRASRQAH